MIERGPDGVPSFLPALVERCAALLPPAARSYSGAVPVDAWTWRSAPFAGGSDHALAASTNRPGAPRVAWATGRTGSTTRPPTRWPTVDAAELRRTAAVVAATVAALRRPGRPELAADVAAATAAWAADHVLAALPGRQPPAPPVTGAAYDPCDDRAARRRLRHRTRVATVAVAALELVGRSRLTGRH